jgi:tripartite-type tricarboxylate transporter receptor subunit TctC
LAGAAARAARGFARVLAGHGMAAAIENVPGEGGLAGVRRANALAREGREPVLLLATPSTHTLLAARLGPSAAPDAAFVPAAGLGCAPNVLLASPRLGVRSVEALVERARAGDLAYGSAGAGQTIHLCTEYLCRLAGIGMTHRPYEAGSAHAYGDLVAGNVHVYFDNLLGCRQAIARGDAVPLAISARERNALMPEVPTLAECGYPDHALDVWFGVFAAGLADDAPRMANAVKDPALAAALREVGLSGAILGPDALAAQVAAAASAWKRALEA